MSTVFLLLTSGGMWSVRDLRLPYGRLTRESARCQRTLRGAVGRDPCRGARPESWHGLTGPPRCCCSRIYNAHPRRPRHIHSYGCVRAPPGFVTPSHPPPMLLLDGVIGASCILCNMYVPGTAVRLKINQNIKQGTSPQKRRLFYSTNTSIFYLHGRIWYP